MMGPYVCAAATLITTASGVYFAATEQWGWCLGAALGTFFWLLNLRNAVRP